MAKVSNETRLVISLFHERAKQKKQQIRGYYKTQEKWAMGAVKGFEEAEEILAGIVKELEHPDRT